MSDPKEKNPWVLQGKLRPPLGHVSLIERPALLAYLNELPNYRVSIVIGPAGYGKTTLLTQWRERLVKENTQVGWFSIDRQDEDPYRFLCYMVFALIRAGVDFGQLEMLAAQGFNELTLEFAVAAFLDLLERSPEQMVLMLDDYHRIEAREIDGMLDRIIENSPPNFHLVISSRRVPGFHVAHLYATGRGMEINTDTLRFSEHDIGRALADIQDEGVLKKLAEMTEGWPVAVQLARFAYRERHDLVALIPAMGREGYIAEFLSEQVVRGLADELQIFLTRTSILDQFNHELANAVYGGQDSWRLLKELKYLSALIVSLDEDGDWYRYHHLFAEYLMTYLHEREPHAVAQLHRNASAWFAREGDTFQAVRHAVLAGDVRSAARLIEDAGGWELILFGGIGYLRNLLSLIPEGELPKFPRLQIAKAYLSLKMGNIKTARYFFDHACAQIRTRPMDSAQDPEIERDILNIGTLLSIYEDEKDPAAYYTETPAVFPDGTPDAVTDSILSCVQAIQRIYKGEFEKTNSTIRKAMRCMRQSGSVLGLNYCFIHSAVNNFHQCNIRQALSNARESSTMAAENFGMDSGLKFLSDVVTVSLLFWRNELTERDWDRFEIALEHIARYDGWFELYALGLETNVERQLLQGNFEAAQGGVSWARKLAHDRNLERLEWHAETMQLRIAVEAGEEAVQAMLASRITKRFPIGTWRKSRFYWRNQVHSSLALADYYAKRHFEKSEACIKDAIACCKHLGANFMLLRCLCSHAILLDRSGRRKEALAVLGCAVQMAEPHGISVALARLQFGLPLLLHAQKQWRQEDEVDATVILFVSRAVNIMRSIPGRHSSESDMIPLSLRELEVLQELSLGRSNKMIARSLDMTEHTVKFHLKNIFKKLSVSRRTEALNAAQRQGLL